MSGWRTWISRRPPIPTERPSFSSTGRSEPTSSPPEDGERAWGLPGQDLPHQLHPFSPHGCGCGGLQYPDPCGAFRASGESRDRSAPGRGAPWRLSRGRTGRTCSPTRCHRSGLGAEAYSAPHTSAPSGEDVSVYAVCHLQSPSGDHAKEKGAKALFSTDLARSELRRMPGPSVSAPRVDLAQLVGDVIHPVRH
jgi:hypothetical protein